ncbi:MAG: PilZ domain-containing protein [Azoarcus sp.]|jgi:hypothetical protein|nr:PilZ domain-containing protein [Azoarcus sp.]
MSFSFPPFFSASFSRQASEVSRRQTQARRTPAAPETTAPPQPAADDMGERRIHQRFIARLRGAPCFWALVEGQRLALSDLSLRGFALPPPGNCARGAQFDFVLQREGVPDEIRGRAEIANLFGKDEAATAGCRLVKVEGDGLARLHDWLVTHVIRSATVRITEKDADTIVSGHSLI